VSRTISPADIEAKFEELRGEVDETAEAAKGTVVTVAAVAGVVVLLAVFVLGKRRGKRKTTIVEVRRF
jgi:hypothetical protein